MSNLLESLQAKFGSIPQMRTLCIDYNAEFLAQLYEIDTCKKRFFVQTPQALIFKKDDFLAFLQTRFVDKSLSRYLNKITLSNTKIPSLFAHNEVVLNFPYKDCVLKGAQDKDDKKGEEIFFNEILAHDEIDCLFAPKVLHHFEFIGDLNTHKDSHRESKTTSITPPPAGCENARAELLNASPNFLIKGNNLLALHSLKKRRDIYGQVKLIYIDPPYNTGNDSFNYNDRFSHSTWLTFMKNRLEIAREFLRDDGVIFIQCDDNEQAYLKVLCDEIFGRENFVGCVVWNSINSVLKQSKFIRKEHEYILIYAKSKQNIIFNRLENTMEFQNIDNDPKGEWFSSNAASPNQDSSKNKFAIKLPNGEECVRNWKFSLEEFESGKISLYFNKGNVPRLKIYKSEYNIYTKVSSSIFRDLGSITTAKRELEALFENATNIFATPKPEALLKRIIEISTNENDLVMDFFAGSGTTCAVAMKMNRRFVGIEQMDYVESITKERLKKVIAGEQWGISKAVGWQGGGGFVYAELLPLNSVYKEQILQSSDEKELEQIYKDLESKAFIDYRVDIRAMLKDKEFHKLKLSEKKQVLYAILDSNMDYVLYDDIEDSTYGVSDEIVKLNKIFYGDCHEFASANSANDKKGGNDE